MSYTVTDKAINISLREGVSFGDIQNFLLQASNGLNVYSVGTCADRVQVELLTGDYTLELTANNAAAGNAVTLTSRYIIEDKYASCGCIEETAEEFLARIDNRDVDTKEYEDVAKAISEKFGVEA